MTDIPTDEMIEAGSRALCRAYQIDDGFSEKQAEQAARGEMGMNFRREARDCYTAMRATDPALKECVETLEKCRDKFREYEGLHALKLRDYKGKEPLNYAAELQYKINRNREMADKCGATLAKFRP